MGRVFSILCVTLLVELPFACITASAESVHEARLASIRRPTPPPLFYRPGMPPPGSPRSGLSKAERDSIRAAKKAASAAEKAASEAEKAARDSVHAAEAAARDSADAAKEAAQDSARVARGKKPLPSGWGSALAPTHGTRTVVHEPTRPSAPRVPHTLWTDRPLTGFGTHTARRGEGEFQIGVVSYARTDRTSEQYVLDSTGVTVRSRDFRYETIQWLAQKLTMGLSSNVDLALVGTLYRRDRFSALDFGTSFSQSSTFDVFGATLRVRTRGEDTTATSSAVALSYAHSDGISVFGIGGSQVFPIVSRLSGRATLQMDVVTGSAALTATFGAIHHTLPDLWLFGEYLGALSLAETDDRAGGLGAGIAVAWGVHVMFDGGARVGLTDNIHDAEYFLGISFR